MAFNFNNLRYSFVAAGILGLLAQPSMAESSTNIPPQSFTAFGTKTAWRAVVTDGKLFLEGKSLASRTIRVKTLPYAKGVEFSGLDRGKTINLNIHAIPCKDAQGNENEFTAPLRHGKKTMKGCAVAGAIEHTPT